MPLDLQQFRTMFENKLKELINSKNVNSCYISKENYARIINRLEYIINVEGMKKTKEDYRLLKKYDLFETRIEGITVNKLKK